MQCGFAFVLAKRQHRTAWIEVQQNCETAWKIDFTNGQSFVKTLAYGKSLGDGSQFRWPLFMDTQTYEGEEEKYSTF